MKTYRSIIILCVLLLVPTTASAGLIIYNSRSTFDADGIIAENYGFEDVPPGVWPFERTWPSAWGQPFGTLHGITYTSTSAFIVGPSVPYNPGQDVWAPLSNVLMDGWMTPLTGSIDTAAQYDMFGVDMAYVGAYSSDMVFQVFTNLGEYTFSLITLPNLNTAQDFYGWIAGSGEYFTGFSFGSQNGNRSAPTIDNVTLGNIVPVPEPTFFLLFGTGLGFLGLVAYWRKRK